MDFALLFSLEFYFFNISMYVINNLSSPLCTVYDITLSKRMSMLINTMKHHQQVIDGWEDLIHVLIHSFDASG